MPDKESSAPAPGPRPAEYALTAALVLAMVFVLYGDRWAQGSTIFRGVVQEQYYILGQYAFDHAIVGQFKAGLFPLWNPYNALGTPLLGNMLSGAFYPLKVLVYVRDTDAVRDVFILLRLIVAALGAHALARRLRMGQAPATLAALAFAFTGYMKMFVNENYLSADVLLPLVALFTLRAVVDRRARDSIILALLVFSVANNGHPEAAFYTLLFPALLPLFIVKGARAKARACLLFAAPVTAGFIMSLPMLLPFVEYWERGYHFHVPGAGFFHYPASRAASIVSPWFYGAVPPGAPFVAAPDVFWDESLSGMPPYAATAVPWLCPAIGAVPLFLAAVAAARPARLSRAELFMLGFAVFFTGVMFGLPPFRAIGYLPVFSLSGNFKHPEPAIALAAAMLAGRGLHSILAGRAGPRLIAGAAGAMAPALAMLAAFSEPLEKGAPFINKHSALALIILAIAAAVAAAYSAGRARAGARETGGASRHRSASTAIVVVGCCMAGLLLDGFQQPMAEVGYEDKLLGGKAHELARQWSPERAYIMEDISPPNLNILAGLHDVRVMDGVNDRRFVRAINRINGHDRDQAGNYWYRGLVGYLQPMPEKIGHPLLRIFGVNAVLARGPLPYNRDARRLIERARVTAPSPGHVGPAYLPHGEGEAPGLYQHPPSRVDIAGDGSGGAIEASFTPAVMRSAREGQVDGVWFVALAKGLEYARYLHPAKTPADATPARATLSLVGKDNGEDGTGEGKPKGQLSLVTLPAGSAELDQAGWADPRLGGADNVAGEFIEVLDSSPRLYRRLKPFPRAFAVSDAVSATEDEALELLAEGKVSPLDTVIISGALLDPPSASGGPPAESSEGAGLDLDYGSQRIAAPLDLPGPRWVVVSDLYYPGWRAFINGEEQRIERADYCLRAVRAPAGKGELVMAYQPWPFRIGLWSLISCLVFAPAATALRRLYPR